MATEHDELESAVGPLVLGVLAADERQHLLAHLQACSSCRELAARLGRAAAALPLEPDPVEPPARLHGRVLAAVAAVRADTPPPARRRQLLLLPGPRRFRLPIQRLPLRLAAAAALAFGLGAGLGVGVGHVSSFRSSDQSASQQVVRHQLHGSGSMAGVQATALSLEGDGLTLVDFKDLPQPEKDQVYELWLITGDGRALPAAVFVPDADGSKVVLLAQDLKGTRQLAVTVEHGPNGSPVPTKRPSLAGAIT